MTTVTDVTTAPASGLAHIDALLQDGPGWNWLTPSRNTLLYSFSLAGSNPSDAGALYTGTLSAFNASQQAATRQALDRVSTITGILFEATSDGAAADLHFSNANLLGPGTTGFASSSWNYRFDGNRVITSYAADAWVYLDNAEFGSSNGSPSVGTVGFEVLLHELGHALGLKHPFEGDVQLPPAENNTQLTLMAYADVGGPYSDYAPYDVAALRFLYGGDGLGGALGHGSPGLALTGTGRADQLTGGGCADSLDGGAGDDVLRGAGGDDTLVGGAGIDGAHYDRARSDYQVQRSGDGMLTVRALAGTEAVDRLLQVERLVFDDRSLAFDLDGHAGTTARILGAVFGPPAVANATYAGIGLALLDDGMSTGSLLQLALDARLGPGYGPAALVDLLYGNLAGTPPSAADRNIWLAALDGGVFTPLSLALAAVDLELNAQNIDLIGLADSGLTFS
jgi:hypothetical protein